MANDATDNQREPIVISREQRPRHAMLAAMILGVAASASAVFAVAFQSWGFAGISLLLALSSPTFFRLFAHPIPIVIDADGFHPGLLRWPMTWERIESVHAPIKPIHSAPWTIRRSPRGWAGQYATMAIVVPGAPRPWTDRYPAAITRELSDALEHLLSNPGERPTEFHPHSSIGRLLLKIAHAPLAITARRLVS